MTIYQGTKVPPHRYLDYTNIGIYTIQIASTVISTSYTIMSTFIKKKFLHFCKLTYFASWPGTFTSCLAFHVVSLDLRDRDICFPGFPGFPKIVSGFPRIIFREKKFRLEIREQKI